MLEKKKRFLSNILTVLTKMQRNRRDCASSELGKWSGQAQTSLISVSHHFFCFSLIFTCLDRGQMVELFSAATVCRQYP